MDIATLGIRIDNGQAVSSVDQLTRRLDILGTTGDSAVGRLKSAFTGFAAATGLSLLGAKFLKETIDSQNAMAQLEARVRSMGGTAGHSVQELDDLSKSMQQVSTFSDEAVKSGEAMLLTFGKIKGDNFNRATQAIIDMSAALGGDLQGAALQVGKALQDPEQGLLALRRAGVSFSVSQQQVIKDLFDTGHEAQAQALILKELEKEFGGSASAARDTFGGALKGLGNDFGDLFEQTKDGTSGVVGFIRKVDEGVKSVHLFGTEIKTLTEVIGGAGLVAVLSLIGPKIVAFASLWAFSVTAAFTTAAAAGTGLTGVLWGLSFVVAPLLAGLAPLALLATAGALAIYDLNKAFDDYNDKIEEASKNTPEYVEYLKALGRAKAHTSTEFGGNVAPKSQADTDASKQLRDFISETQAQTDKQRALNAAYMGSATALAVMGAQLEGAIAKAKEHKDAKKSEWGEIDRAIDALTRENVQAAKLAAVKQNAQDTTQQAAANALMVQGAKDADLLATANLAVAHAQLVLAGTSDMDAAAHRAASDAVEIATANVLHLQAAQDAAAKMNAADVEYRKAVIGATKEEVGWAKDKLNETYRTISAEQSLKDATIDRVAAQEHANAVAKEQVDFQKSIAATVMETIRGLGNIKDQTAQFVRDQKNKQEEYQKDLRQILSDGIGKITTDGFKSFHDFFEDVFQLFSKLMARMQQEGKDSGFGFGAMKYASAGIAGGLTGYQVGSQGGTPGSGALSGAVAGFAVAGPYGAAAGALVGAAGELLGAAKASKEAAEAQKAAQQSAYTSLLQMNVTAGTSSQRAADVAATRIAADQLFDAIDKALPGLKNQTEREKELAQVRADEVIIVAKINEAEKIKAAQEAFAQFRALQDLRLRNLSAQGLTAEAKAYQDALEVQDAMNQGRSAEYVALLKTTLAIENETAAKQKAAEEAANNGKLQEELSIRMLRLSGNLIEANRRARAMDYQSQIQQAIAGGAHSDLIQQLVNVQNAEEQAAALQDVKDALTKVITTMTDKVTSALREQLTVAQGQLDAAKNQLTVGTQALQATQKAAEALTQYRDSLSLGSLSALSPVQQYATAKATFDALASQAAGGNLDAASKLPDAGNAFLSQSRNYNASGIGFANDSARVQSVVGSLASGLTQEQSDQQKIVDAAQHQVDLLTVVTDTLKQQLDAMQASADQITKAIQDSDENHIGAVVGMFRDYVTSYQQEVLGIAGAILPTAEGVFTAFTNTIHADAQSSQYLLDKIFGVLTGIGNSLLNSPVYPTSTSATNPAIPSNLRYDEGLDAYLLPNGTVYEGPTPTGKTGASASSSTNSTATVAALQLVVNRQDATIAVLQSGLSQLVEASDANTKAIADNTRITRQGLEAMRAAVA